MCVQQGHKAGVCEIPGVARTADLQICGDTVPGIISFQTALALV